MNEAVTLTFIFQTIGVILLTSAVAVMLIKIKTNKLKKDL
jgi:hypothetical protein